MPKQPVSSHNLSPLPEIESLRKRMQQMAALTAVVGIEFGTPPFEFHPQWAKGEQMGAYKNGSGDELFAHFTQAGCFIKGFAHESSMTPYRTDPPTLWPGLFDDVPPQFASSLQEPAFDIPATTFAVWRLAMDEHWNIGPVKFPQNYDGDGSPELLGRLVVSAEEFTEWLSENYEADVDAEIVAAVFDHQPLTMDQLRTLQPSVKVADLTCVVKDIGYPVN
jgi:hypothetical protein